MKLVHTGTVLGASLFVSSMAMPTSKQQQHGKTVAETPHEHPTFANIGTPGSTDKVSFFRLLLPADEHPSQPYEPKGISKKNKRPSKKPFDPYEHIRENENNKVMQLKLHVFNKNTGKVEAHDPKKHVDFPTHLDWESKEQALDRVDQEAKEKGLSREERDMKRENTRNMHEASKHLVHEGGVIHDEKGYVYTHDPSGDSVPSPRPNGTYLPSKLVEDPEGRISIYPHDDHPYSHRMRHNPL